MSPKFATRSGRVVKPFVFGLLVLLAAVWAWSALLSQDGTGERATAAAEQKIKYWTCSMHPQIKLPNPGQCPICGMDLVPVYEGGNPAAEGEVSLSLNAAARKLAQVETSVVEYKAVYNDVRLVGKVDYDETRLSYISAWVPGRIDRLFVDFTGTRVRQGDHLIKLYSPELISAQEEYIQAMKNWDDTRNSELAVMRDTAQSTLKSSKEKLRLLGISNPQIETIAADKTVQEHLTINSPVAGTVIQKNGFEGQYVKTGDRIYTIADLSRVWVYIDAYESDIQWLHYGQHVRVEAEAYPGEMFDGKIAFIDPYVDEKTRTIKLRVNVENEDNKLKPGMFVRAHIKAALGEAGEIYEQELAGKWICPMHPEIVKDEKGICDVCEMDLIPTREFGFAEQPVKSNEVLVIPKSAPLITGKRAVVYVETQDDEEISLYEGREVVLGPRAGDEYVVLSGLRPGEKVVTKGNFKIDSALQIQAKPSMMNPADHYNPKDNLVSQTAGSVTENAGILSTAMPAYLSAAQALSTDDAHRAAQSLAEFRDQLTGIMRAQAGAGQDMNGQIQGIIAELQSVPHEIKSLREKFRQVSLRLKSLIEEHGYRADKALYLTFCPMAFGGEGAYWFQENETIANPYYGERMLRCGSVENTFGLAPMNSADSGSMKGSAKGSMGHQH
ncbi:MAG: efflux RND transporter periplasmic adaptor subunit [Candidatus Omnitrophica bacterium]|nr:efflux RND transporter periplasmic adaptor subunit [Candidatus Omnitrophota bacterium]MCB9720150.1 efflux RND transporter periplasmic adaptor subunit [Candidatus Omnitrophota bacterium]